MLLNGWKGIAAYLQCGVRTVQRWEQLGLPVLRVRRGKRGPVIAYSESLDSWIRSRTIHIKPRRGARSDIEPTLQQSASILETTIINRQTTIDQIRVLMRNELAIGMMLAKLALRSGNPKTVSRETALARHAYDTIMRLSQRITVPGIQTKAFAAQRDRLRATLRKLGETL